MGRKKKKQKNDDDLKLFDLGDVTKSWIFALFAFAAIVFFMLAAFGKAGLVGRTIFTIFGTLFGFGYYLFPAIFLMLGITFIRSNKNTFKFTYLAGSVIFFFSGLGLIELLAKNGGFVGETLTLPLITFFDIYASLVLLGTLFLVSVILTIDTAPSFAWLLSLIRKKEETDDEDVLKDKEGVEENVLLKNTPEEAVKESATKDPEEESSGSKEGGQTFKKIFGFNKPAAMALSTASQGAHNHFTENYKMPPIELLQYDRGKPGVGDIKASANIIKRTLQNFGISVEMDEVSVGPSVTRYSFKPAQGVKLSRIVGLKNDLSLALAAHPIRIEAPIPGKSLMGIEIPNTAKTTVGLASLLSHEEFRSSGKPLILTLGRSVTGKPLFGDFAKMPHLLIAGATGSGKSVSIHTIVISLLYRNAPENLRFIMIDPKRVELTLYNKIPHLLTPVITDSKKAILALKWAAKEMERRYDILETESVRDITSYHKNIVSPAYERFSNATADAHKNLALPERMPYIVIIIDELADIMSAYPRELEAGIVRLAQMSRAVGIHLLISTQRPSVNVLTGLIKANIPVRMAFQVASQIDSRTILDMGGAETLLGAGDMLYVSGEMSKPVRLQSAFISETEIKKVVKHLSGSYVGEPSDIMFSGPEQESGSIWNAIAQSNADDNGDELYEEARDTVVSAARASTTFLQRKFRIGYARAARIMDLLEERGIVGPSTGAKPREILVKNEQNIYEERPTETPEAEEPPTS